MIRDIFPQGAQGNLTREAATYLAYLNGITGGSSRRSSEARPQRVLPGGRSGQLRHGPEGREWPLPRVNAPNNWYGIRDHTGDQGFQFISRR